MDDFVLHCKGSNHYIAQCGSLSADGRTERHAILALEKKIFESKSEEERIREFVEMYSPDAELTVDEWMAVHRGLTGACGMGAYRFVKKIGLKRYDKKTTTEFLNIVESAYASELIKKVKQMYAKEG